MAAKYKEYVNKMLEANKELFDQFRPIHDEYALNPATTQDKFNQMGAEVMVVIREYEDKLCRQSEIGGYGTYAGKLAEKFNEEVAKHFPKITSVGVIKKKMAPLPAGGFIQDNGFAIKKIDLN